MSATTYFGLCFVALLSHDMTPKSRAIGRAICMYAMLIFFFMDIAKGVKL